MRFNLFRFFTFKPRSLDLQAKISLILVGVILPTYLIITVAENKLTQPIFSEEMKQIGITAGKSFAAEIVSQRLLTLSNPTSAIEKNLQEFLYSQPSITRMDVFVKDPGTGGIKVIASNVEEEPGSAPVFPSLIESVTSEYKTDEQGLGSWEIFLPIKQSFRDPGIPKKILGNIHVVVSMKVVEHLMDVLWKITAIVAVLSVAILILILSYFLRKTINNDRLLRLAETQNLQLTEQLHELQRQLMNTEKLAVMGQLTASFAHEMGTPLNAIGGHLQLLKEDLKNEVLTERFEIIQGQLGKIEQVVKGFLQSTAKPTTQRQLIDINLLVERTLAIVQPRILSSGVEVHRDLDRNLGPIRVVPLEMEQILLNILSNSLDSLKTKFILNRKPGLLEVSTVLEKIETQDHILLSVYDTGEGIKKEDLKNVLKPFFTTKKPGEGTGLGLTICQELVKKQGGMLEIDSKEGAWTRVALRLPYSIYEGARGENTRSG